MKEPQELAAREVPEALVELEVELREPAEIMVHFAVTAELVLMPTLQYTEAQLQLSEVMVRQE